MHRKLLPSDSKPVGILARHNYDKLCGHKLELDKPQYRALLTRTLHPNSTRAKELVREVSTVLDRDAQLKLYLHTAGRPMARSASRQLEGAGAGRKE